VQYQLRIAGLVKTMLIASLMVQLVPPIFVRVLARTHGGLWFAGFGDFLEETKGGLRGLEGCRSKFTGFAGFGGL